jgi:hypothetical protein
LVGRRFADGAPPASAGTHAALLPSPGAARSTCRRLRSCRAGAAETEHRNAGAHRREAPAPKPRRRFARAPDLDRPSHGPHSSASTYSMSFLVRPSANTPSRSSNSRPL